MVNCRPTTLIVGKKKTFEDAEAKKQNLIMGVVAANSVRICVPCNVVCNSEIVCATHLAGEKHSLMVVGHSSEGANVVRTAIPSQAMAVLNKASQKKAKLVETLSCNICKLECNCEEVHVHMVGKMHMENMKKLESSTAKPAAEVLPIGDKQGKSDKDPEAKTQTMLENGTPVDAIVICTVCNIPCNYHAKLVEILSCNICKLKCNSEEVHVHTVGKKHMENMKKLKSPTAKLAEKVLPVGDKQMKSAKHPDAKIRTMLDNGTPIDTIIVCIVCNIPFNCQAAFDSHVFGQRHINQLK